MTIDYSTTADLLKALAATQSETLAYFDLPDEQLQASYAPGKWNVRQLLHHITDAETVLHERIRRGIARPKQVVYGFDQDAWCQALDYATRPLPINKALFVATRAAIIDLAERYYEQAGQQQYVHSETGLRTVKEELDKVA